MRSREPYFTSLRPDLEWGMIYLVDEAKPRAIRSRGALAVSPDGVAVFDGSVRDWTQDCAAPALAARCPAYLVGGEHMTVIPSLERDPARGGCVTGSPSAHPGMRAVSDLAPSYSNGAETRGMKAALRVTANHKARVGHRPLVHDRKATGPVRRRNPQDDRKDGSVTVR